MLGGDYLQNLKIKGDKLIAHPFQHFPDYSRSLYGKELMAPGLNTSAYMKKLSGIECM